MINEKELFVNTINQLRKDNKNKWYFWTGRVDNKAVQIKGFGTWLQIFKVDNVSIHCVSDLSVKAFKTVLERV